MKKFSRHFRFYRRFLSSLNPLDYSELADYPFKVSFTYYMSLIFSIFVIMAILFLPVIINWPAELSEKFDKFEEFQIGGNVETIEPIKFTEQRPFLVLNSKSYVKPDEGTIVIDGGVIHYNILFKQFLINLTGYSDVKEHRNSFVPLILLIFVLMLPSILLISYFWFAAKYAILIAIGSLLALGITKLIRFEIKFKEIINIAVFASSLTIILGIIALPFGINLKYLQLIPFAVYLIAGTIRVGKFKERRKSRGGFIEVHE